MRRLHAQRLLVLFFTVTIASTGHALDIVVGNDDGFESALTHALYRKLKAAGHRVIISAPAQDQSGQGSATAIFKPLPSLEQDSRGGAVKTGAPAFGTLPGDADVHYVDGSPGMAMLYAIDRLAPLQWQKRPDLVVSGPNYGNNLGGAALGSGTIAAALFAVNRGIPAIAVSAGHSYRYRPVQQLADGDIDHEIAEVTVRLIAQLEKQTRKMRKPLLPQGTGLNVNIPAFAAGGGKALHYRMTRLGHQAGPYYSDDLAQDANAQAFGLALPAAPGFAWALKVDPAGLSLPKDSSARAEANAIRSNVVTVSVLRGIPQAERKEERAVRRQLRSLIDPGR
jgi:5'-nucleotidase